jgi:hypothetical protein
MYQGVRRLRVHDKFYHLAKAVRRLCPLCSKIFALAVCEALNRKQKVQECDARMLNSSTVAKDINI